MKHNYKYIGSEGEVKVNCCQACGLNWEQYPQQENDSFRFASDAPPPFIPVAMIFTDATSADIEQCPNVQKGIIFQTDGKLISI